MDHINELRGVRDKAPSMLTLRAVIIAISNIFPPFWFGNDCFALLDSYESFQGEYWNWYSPEYGQRWSFNSSNMNPCADRWRGIGCSCLPSEINYPLPTYYYDDSLDSPAANFDCSIQIIYLASMNLNFMALFPGSSSSIARSLTAFWGPLIVDTSTFVSVLHVSPSTLSSDISFASSKFNVAWDQQYSNVVWRGKQISETLLTLQELNHLYISSSDCRCHDIKNELYSSAGKYNRDSDGRK